MIDAPPTKLEVAAIICEALTDVGVQPVIVGGLALAYWTSGGDEHITGDIDVVVPSVPELASRLQALGFEKTGREWILPGHEVAFEAPGEILERGDEAEWAELASGRRLRILSVEDVLLWRLREWLYWHHTSGFHQAAHLLASEALDSERLDARARDEGLTLALSALRSLTAEIAAGRTMEEWELVRLGKDVERDIYRSNGDD